MLAVGAPYGETFQVHVASHTLNALCSLYVDEGGAVYLIQDDSDSGDNVRHLSSPSGSHRFGKQVHLFEDLVAVGAVTYGGEGEVLVFSIDSKELLQKLNAGEHASCDFGNSFCFWLA